MSLSDQKKELLQRVSASITIPDEEKLRILDFAAGRLLPPLTLDSMAKHLFSPDTNPERFDFIMQRVMQDPTIKSRGSASNELPLEMKNAKKTITDLSSWLTDKRFASLEIQQIAQEFSYERYDLYTSRMFLLQYAVDEGRKKGEINYENIKGVVMVVLMRDSPKFLKNKSNPRYIHRFKSAISDSGISIPVQKKIAFVELDKALEQFLSKTYNEDEDYELLLELAMLRDANNENVRSAAMENEALKSMYDDAARFTLSIEEQIRLIDEELSHYDLEYTMRKREEEGIEQGIPIGENRINDLNSWLFANGRDEDVKKATSDPEYRAKLLEEFQNSQAKTQEIT